MKLLSGTLPANSKLLSGTLPANNKLLLESQHPEAWPASTYEHLRKVWVIGAVNEHWALGTFQHGKRSFKNKA